MGVIELIVILLALTVIPVVLGSAALFGSNRSQNVRRSRSHVDWPKVTMVFLGVPFLLLAIPFMLYFLTVQRSVHQEQLHSQAMVESEIAAYEAQTRAMKESIKIEESGIEEGDAEHQVELKTQPSVTSDPPVTSTESFEGYSVQDGPTEHGVAIPFVQRSRDSVGMRSIAAIFVTVIALIFLGALIWISRKNGMLAFGIVCGILLLGFVGLTTTRVSYQSHSPGTVHVDSIHLPQESPIAHSETSKQLETTGLIPVGADNADAKLEAKPLRTREVVYVDRNKREINTSDRLPKWVTDADGKNTIHPSKNEIVLTSKRYTSIEEATAELRPLAGSMLTDFIARTYPEMRASSVDPALIEELGLLQKSCQVTWPLQVGEFTQEMQQLVWKLDISQGAQQKIHHQWQQQEVNDRLAILGGSLGGLTLLFGAGALLTRRREGRKAA